MEYILNTFRNLFLWGAVTVLFTVFSTMRALSDDQSPTVMIPDVLIYSEPDSDDAAAVLVVDKRRQLILRYVFDSEWREMQRWPCSTGKAAGPKRIEGDQKTPEGLYFITRNVGHPYLTETYGSRALVLDYPNAIDRRHGRTGGNIWLHGTNKPLRERDSNGCVVLANSDIDALAGRVQLQRTPVIIVDRLEWWSQREAADTAAVLLNQLQRWQDALLGDSYDRFRHWYAGSAVPTQQWWQTWCRLRQNYAVDASALKSQIRSAVIYRHQGIIVIMFEHDFNVAQRRVPAGRRKLSLRMVNQRVRIIEDTYYGGPEAAEPASGEEPLFAAWRRLWRYRDGNDTSFKQSDLEDHDT